MFVVAAPLDVHGCSYSLLKAINLDKIRTHVTFVLSVRAPAPAPQRSLDNNRFKLWHPRNVFNPNSDRSASYLYELQAEKHDCKSPGLPDIQAAPLPRLLQ
jgi:hypothetical protein